MCYAYKLLIKQNIYFKPGKLNYLNCPQPEKLIKSVGLNEAIDFWCIKVVVVLICTLLQKYLIIKPFLASIKVNIFQA